MSQTIVHELAAEYESTIGILRETIGHLDDEAWVKGATLFQVPAKVAYHTTHHLGSLVSLAVSAGAQPGEWQWSHVQRIAKHPATLDLGGALHVSRTFVRYSCHHLSCSCRIM